MSIKGPHSLSFYQSGPMRSRRSISDIVAVVLLIVIAIAAAVIIYMWLSGLIGSVHTSTSATQVKLEITGASVRPSSGGTTYTVTASVYNPPASPTVSIATAELEFTNGTLICSTPLTTVITTTTTTPNGSTATTTTTTVTAILPSSSATVTFNCITSASLPAGTPVEIVLVTSEGVQVTYTATVS